MNTKRPHTAKLIHLSPKPQKPSKALESILRSLEMIEQEIANHFAQEI